jgi:hypothetical protein
MVLAEEYIRFRCQGDSSKPPIDFIGEALRAYAPGNLPGAQAGKGYMGDWMDGLRSSPEVERLGIRF